MTAPAFHLAFPVDDLAAARAFYAELLGCPEGRSSERWVDFDFFGHQIVAHLAPREPEPQRNEVDGDRVPARHFGVILDWDGWHTWAERLGAAGVAFLIEPHVRFEGRVGEQATMFFCDPAGNTIELKAFRNPADVFTKGS